MTDTKRNPNILFILSDQHRADCLGCYGNPDVRTPHLDGLAAEGTRYESMFCPYPLCTPSRYSLLSGLYVHEHRCGDNFCTLPEGTATFPSLFKEAGYRTAAVGKMHFTPTYLDVGFERMTLCEQDGPGRWDDDYHRELRELGLVDANDLEDQRSEYRQHARREYFETAGALPTNLPAEYHSTEWIARKAMEQLGEWSGGGNLLMVGFVKPHHPFDPPREWADAYDPATIRMPAGYTSTPLDRDMAVHWGYFPAPELTETAIRRAAAYYYATIEHMDAQIGRMLELLKARGLYEDTIVVYTSDHGEYLGYHHMLLKGGYMYDPMMRVPLVVRQPAARGAGGVHGGMASNIDVAPTLLRLAGLEPAPAMHGIDLRPEAAGRNVVFAESVRGDQVMARSRRRKLLVSRQPAKTLLFDLERDPYEMVDVSEERAYAADRDKLERALSEWPGAARRYDIPVDENARTIAGPNVPVGQGHRASIEEYYARAMADWRRSQGLPS